MSMNTAKQLYSEVIILAQRATVANDNNSSELIELNRKFNELLGVMIDDVRIPEYTIEMLRLLFNDHKIPVNLNNCPNFTKFTTQYRDITISN